ncbi:MAG TPA: hypothetical protein VGL86_22900 [Polyangia bacterium]|jgi:hypothetical protein
MAFVPAFAAHDQVDMLFVILNSIDAPIQQELQVRFPELVKALDDAAAAGHPASYHIGVVTTDLGSGAFSQACAGPPTGGKLIAGPSPQNSFPAPTDCATFKLTDGAAFIDYDQVAGTSNVGGINSGHAGDDVAGAFVCTSSVGDQGCPVQQALESAYETLHDGAPENAAFLRDDALLVVVFLADKDECSLPADSDLFDPSADGVAKYGALSSFRCAQFGTSCTTPPMPLDVSVAAGPLDDCTPLDQADGGKLIDVGKYIDYFTRPGGVKPDPSDVILAAFIPPPAPVGWEITTPCTGDPQAASCPVPTHSCIAANNPAFFGNPTVRLSAVVDAALTSQRTSICDTNFSPGMASLAQSIIARLKWPRATPDTTLSGGWQMRVANVQGRTKLLDPCASVVVKRSSRT